MTLNNKKCECPCHKEGYECSKCKEGWHLLTNYPATPKNSEWEEPIRRVVIGALKSCKDAHGKVDVSSAEKRVTHALREPIQTLLQERSKDTVGELIEKLGDDFKVLWKGWGRAKWIAAPGTSFGDPEGYQEGSTPLEALQKLSEQIEQK